MPCIRCSAGGTYRLLLASYCCLVVQSWEPMQFHVRTPIRTICVLTVILAGCEANPSVVEEADTKPATAQFIAQSGHSPPFARTPYAPFTRAEAVGIALQEWRLFGQRVDDNPPQAHFEPAAGEDPARMPGQWERIGEYWWLGQDADRRESAWTGMYDENGQEIDARRDDYYAWSAAFISYVMRTAGAGPRFPILAVALRLYQHRQGDEAGPHVGLGGDGRAGGRLCADAGRSHLLFAGTVQADL